MVSIRTSRASGIADLSRGGHAVHARHPHVHHHDVNGFLALRGMQRAAYRLLAVLDLVDEQDVRGLAEDEPHPFAEDGVVVGEQHPDAQRATSSASLIATLSAARRAPLVPLPPRRRTYTAARPAQQPVRASSRSRVRGGASGEIPRPSSATASVSSSPWARSSRTPQKRRRAAQRWSAPPRRCGTPPAPPLPGALGPPRRCRAFRASDSATWRKPPSRPNWSSTGGRRSWATRRMSASACVAVRCKRVQPLDRRDVDRCPPDHATCRAASRVRRRVGPSLSCSSRPRRRRSSSRAATSRRLWRGGLDGQANGLDRDARRGGPARSRRAISAASRRRPGHVPPRGCPPRCRRRPAVRG